MSAPDTPVSIKVRKIAENDRDALVRLPDGEECVVPIAWADFAPVGNGVFLLSMQKKDAVEVGLASW